METIMLYTTYEPYMGSNFDEECDLLQFIDEDYKKWCAVQSLEVDEKDFEDE